MSDDEKPEADQAASPPPGRQPILLLPLAVGVGFYNLAFMIGLGTLLSLVPVIAHAYGAKEDLRVGVCPLALQHACSS